MSSISLDDIMSFMKKDKLERAKERELDKVEFMKMIKSGVKEEVQCSLKPLQERQDRLEAVQEELGDKFTKVIELVNDLKTKVDSNIIPTRPKSTLSADSSTSVGFLPAADISTGEPDALNEKLNEVIDMARRTVGLSRIDNDDISRMKQEQYGGASSEAEARLFAVREYLRCELKICDEDIKKMEIENIFTPTGNKDDPSSLNVTFKDMLSVIKIYEKTRIMRKESRINTYIPWQFQDRLRAISAFDYNLRQDKRYQTRIKMGLKGLELHKKLRGSKNRWERVSLPDDLPPVDIGDRRPTLASNSPPPGRPRLSSKRGWVSSGSDSEQIIPKQKVAKQSDASEIKKNVVKQKSFAEMVEEADLVTEGPISPVTETTKKVDQGNFADVVIQSPIFHKTRQVNQKI